ncbi:hypothetical protein FSP39_020734 [Pinctada imbricata]|uniref:Carboxylic ester hydrolase n=1 Tax=Pinctada imbricata TaxID=66713 RepID=A0AA89C456_PINIB|nr:hypothetical protein FSP39_020734 [Pinctada imbricata]
MVLILEFFFIILWIGTCTGVFVETTSGWIRGAANRRAISFLGVPFADPPRRWEDAQPPRRWRGVWDARRVRPMCIQPACVTGQRLGLCLSQMSEDCLYLNMYVPVDATPGGNKSVMVFIHGGNFLSYTGGAALFNGETIAERGDVILVTINYRLGALGFLVTGSGPGAATGNYGLKDQRLALYWINRNIDRFGGDPQKVTIFGQSAGAVSAAIHMISRKADRYFQQVIIQSLPFSIPLKTFNEAYEQGSRFSEALSCSPQDLPCLRRKTPREILRAQGHVTSGKSSSLLQRFMPWTPHYDGNEVPMDIQTAFQRRLYGRKPIIIGTTTNEGASYVYEYFRNPLNAISYSALLMMLKPKDAFTWLSRYYPRDPNDSREKLSELTTDFIFTCPARKFAKIVSEDRVPIWMYVFNHGLSPLNGTRILEYCHARACHGGELPYLFQTLQRLGLPLSIEEMQMSDEMLIYWTNFAKFGNPNGESEIVTGNQWPRYSTNQSYPLTSYRFQIPSSDVVVDNLGVTCDQFDQNDFSAK